MHLTTPNPEREDTLSGGRSLSTTGLGDDSGGLPHHARGNGERREQPVLHARCSWVSPFAHPARHRPQVQWASLGATWPSSSV